MTMRYIRVLFIVPFLVLETCTLPAFADDADRSDYDLKASTDTTTVTITGTYVVESPSVSSGDPGFGGDPERSFEPDPDLPSYGKGGESVSLPDGRTYTAERMANESHCDWLHRTIVSTHPCWRNRPRPTTDEPPADPEQEAMRVMHTAIALASIHGAGLVVQPTQDWVYLGAPTLAHATTPVVETSVEMFGMSVPVRFEAQEFLFDFHSGARPIRTTSPGAPYPDMSIQSVYQHEAPKMHVTLTTTWTAHVTHPTTGQTLTVPGALRTVEDSAPFRVIRPRIRLIAPDEFGKPHH